MLINPGQPQDLAIDNIFVNGEIREWVTLEPQQTVIFSTPQIQLPDDFYGVIYQRRNFWEKGVLLNCPSFINNGYIGSLRGMIINMTSQRILVSRNDEILTVMLTSNPGTFNNQNINENVNRELQGLSLIFPKSFLDVSTIRRTFIRDIQGESLKTFGIIATLLVAFFTVHSYVTEKTARERFESFVKTYDIIEDREKMLQKLNTRIKNLETSKHNVKTKYQNNISDLILDMDAQMCLIKSKNDGR